MIKAKVNPLNIHSLRRVRFPAEHFYFIHENANINEKQLEEWINSNLNGRYYLGPGIVLHNNVIEYTWKLGFEIEKECSFFKLACPLINCR